MRDFRRSDDHSIGWILFGLEHCRDNPANKPAAWLLVGSLLPDRSIATLILRRLANELENHAAATARYYFAYNFIKIHRTLRTSPAMAAGVTDRLWSVEDLVALWEAYEQRRAERQVA